MQTPESGYDTETRRRALVESLRSLDALHIPPQQLQFTNEPLGSGGFGDVLLAIWETQLGGVSGEMNRWYVAVKWLQPKQYTFLRLALRFVRELKVWSTFQHPNILVCLGFNIDLERGEAFFVCPYLPRGNIRSRLNTDSTISIEQRKKWMVDVTTGLDYLHSLTPPVAHGDLKSENILLDDADCAVLCDFGLSSVMEDSTSTGLTTSDGFKGSLRWCSPELLDNEKRTTFSDMWAWALCVLEIATGRLPFYNARTEAAICRRILGQCLTREEYPELPPDSRIWETLERCFKKDPTERPPAHECLAQLSYTLPPGTCSTVKTWGEECASVVSVSCSGRLVLLACPDENDPERSSNVFIEDLVSGDRMWIMRRMKNYLWALDDGKARFSDDERSWAWWDGEEGRLYIYDIQGRDPELALNMQLHSNALNCFGKIYFMGTYPNRQILVFHRSPEFDFGLEGISSILPDTRPARMTYTSFLQHIAPHYFRLSPTNQYLVIQQHFSMKVVVHSTSSFFSVTDGSVSFAAFPQPIFTLPAHDLDSPGFWISNTAYAMHDPRGLNIWDVENRKHQLFHDRLDVPGGSAKYQVMTASWLVYHDREMFHFLHTPTILASPGDIDRNTSEHPPHFRVEEAEDAEILFSYLWNNPDFVIFRSPGGTHIAKRIPRPLPWWRMKTW